MRVLIGSKDLVEFELATLVPFDTGKYRFKSRAVMEAMARTDPKLHRHFETVARPAIRLLEEFDEDILIQYALISDDSARLSQMTGRGISVDHELSLRLTLNHLAPRGFVRQLEQGELPEIITLHFLAPRPEAKQLLELRYELDFLREIERDLGLYNGNPLPPNAFFSNKSFNFAFVTISGHRRPAIVECEFVEHLKIPFMPITPARCKLWVEGETLWAFDDPKPYKLPKKMVRVIEAFIDNQGEYLKMSQILDMRYGTEGSKETRSWHKMFRFKDGLLVKKKFFEKKVGTGVRIRPVWMGATDHEISRAIRDYYLREDNMQRLYHPELVMQRYMRDLTAPPLISPPKA